MIDRSSTLFIIDGLIRGYFEYILGTLERTSIGYMCLFLHEFVRHIFGNIHTVLAFLLLYSAGPGGLRRMRIRAVLSQRAIRIAAVAVIPKLTHQLLSSVGIIS